MNGVATLEAIKAQRPKTEVIMLSGHADLKLAMACMTLGAFDFLIKPVGLDELTYRIQDAHKTHELEGTGTGPESGTVS
jgi:DNA-binding NtrC family response regulator